MVNLNIEITKDEKSLSGTLEDSLPTISVKHPNDSLSIKPLTDSVLSPSLPIPDEGQSVRMAQIRALEE